MSEFTELIKEAFVEVDSYESPQGIEELKQSVRKFDARMRTIRFMTWFSVTFFGACTALAIVQLVRASEETSIKTLLLYTALCVWSFVGVGISKMWLALMQGNIGVMKELKRLQIALLEVSTKRG